MVVKVVHHFMETCQTVTVTGQIYMAVHTTTRAVLANTQLPSHLKHTHTHTHTLSLLFAACFVVAF